MDKNWTRIDIPVPPEPILENSVGYWNERGARYLALWWEPAGDEVMVSDGFVTFTGNWAGYLAYVHHPKVFPHLANQPLGSSDEPARVCLVIDLQDRRAFIVPIREAEKSLVEQWQSEPHQVPIISLDDLERWLETVVGSLTAPTMKDVFRRMKTDRQHVAALQDWLESCQIGETPKGGEI
jgi:hypothetical protein